MCLIVSQGPQMTTQALLSNSNGALPLISGPSTKKGMNQKSRQKHKLRKRTTCGNNGLAFNMTTHVGI